MTGYVIPDIVRHYRGMVSPYSAYVILSAVSVDQLKAKVRNHPDPAVRQRVWEELDGLVTAAKIHTNGLPVPEAPPSPSLTSCETFEAWISAKEAAAILGKGPRMVSNYRAAGDITGRKKDGRTWEYDKASVEEFALQLQLKAA